jgi:hypothetical protein
VIWGGPILPPSIDQTFFIAVGLAVVGFVLVLAIERMSISDR